MTVIISSKFLKSVGGFDLETGLFVWPVICEKIEFKFIYSERHVALHNCQEAFISCMCLILEKTIFLKKNKFRGTKMTIGVSLKTSI